MTCILYVITKQQTMRDILAIAIIVASSLIGILFGFFIASIVYSCSYTHQRQYQEINQKIIELRKVASMA